MSPSHEVRTAYTDSEYLLSIRPPLDKEGFDKLAKVVPYSRKFVSGTPTGWPEGHVVTNDFEQTLIGIPDYYLDESGMPFDGYANQVARALRREVTLEFGQVDSNDLQKLIQE
jgi:hypothetical protein